MNIPFLGKKIKWYNMSDLNETELKKGFFRPNQKFCTDDSKRSNIVVDHLNVTIPWDSRQPLCLWPYFFS